MAVLYEGRVGASWETGEPLLIIVPDSSVTDAFNLQNKTLDSLIIEGRGWFDNTYTVFCNTDAVKIKYETLGITQVISVEGYTQNNPFKLWVSENKHIDIWENSSSRPPFCYMWNGDENIFGGTVGLNISSAEPAGTIRYVNQTLTYTNVFTVYKPDLINSYLSARWNPDNVNVDKCIDFWRDIEPIVPSSDPYSKGGESETGGGTGDFDGTSDAIPIPDLPTLSATSTGFITLFNPTTAQLQSLANYMWSNSLFDLDTWKKIFADPMDAILGLSIVPVAVPSGGSAPVSVGNISTDVSMTTAAAQYVAVDCGTLNINEYWGAYLDYDPFTKAEIYLPYIGTHALAVDDIMGKAVHVVYHVDILSGACAAYVQCGESVLYTFIGQCASSIPITGNDWTNVINGVISAAASVGSMVATSGATAPLVVPGLASTAVNGTKPSVEKSGSLAGTGGMLGIQTPYIILTRPRQALPAFQNGFMGYPSFITENLGSISGYTEIESIHLENVPATEQELSEIESLLKGGVIF